MPKILRPGERYSGRAPGIVPVNVSMEKTAYELLKALAPTRKSYGHLLSQLVYAHAERQRVLGRVAELLEEGAGDR